METAIIETKEIEQGRMLVEESKGYPRLPAVISSAESYSLIGTWVVKAKERMKAIEEYFKPRKEKARSVHTDWCNAEKETLAPYKDYVDRANNILTAYSIEKEKVRKSEEERLRQEALKREEEERLQAAIEAEAGGNNEEAEAIISEPVFIPPPIVPKSVPKVNGLAQRTNWTYRIVDENKIPRQYLKPDEVKIAQLVRALKDKTNIPGIEVYPETKMAGVRR